MAIVWAVQKLEEFLYARRFTVITDHSSLVWMREGRTLKSRIDKWARALSEYHFDIQFREGKQNVIADFLSRYPNEGKKAIEDPYSQAGVALRMFCLRLIMKNATQQSQEKANGSQDQTGDD